MTQTYLTKVENESKLFVYYFFENYVAEQKAFTEKLQRGLGDLGAAFGRDVSLFMPNPDYRPQIEAQMRKFKRLWDLLHDHLPGLTSRPGHSPSCRMISLAAISSPSSIRTKVTSTRRSGISATSSAPSRLVTRADLQSWPGLETRSHSSPVHSVSQST